VTTCYVDRRQRMTVALHQNSKRNAPQTGGVPIIINQLGPRLQGPLEAHWSRPRVIAHRADAAPWKLSHLADILITRPWGWSQAPETRPKGWPNGLKWIQTASTGVDPFPSWLFDGPAVTCARGVAAAPIAEYVLTAMLNHEKRFDAIAAHSLEDWRQIEERYKDKGDNWLRSGLGGLEGRVLALAGYGAIGQAIARRAIGFGMKVRALRRSPWTEGDPDANVEAVPHIAALVEGADHLVLALPLTNATRRIIDAPVLARARPTLHIVNIARGGLIDQDALLDALDEGRLGGATLDVTDPEPLPENHPFYAHPRIRLTPHISWADTDLTGRLIDKVIANLDRHARGEPLDDVVTQDAGY
jgi:phosphoglycerate dehydrogenase-like enzyme